MSTASHVAHACTTIQYGVPMISSILYSIGSFAVGFGLGWYVKGRGLTGVQNDLNNVKTDVEALKAKVMPVATTPTAAVA